MNEMPKFYMPAEWELHQATWLTWPKDPITWPDRLPQAELAYARMIEALTPLETVHLLVDDADTEARLRRRFASLKQPANLRIHVLPTADSWIRDYGPIFVKAGSEAVMLDWIFNAWGNKYAGHLVDDDIPQKLGKMIKVPVIEPGIVLEGGSIEVNGQGSLLTTEQCLLNANRNPQMNREEIESYLKRFLGVSQILWLGEGVAGDDTDGHIDDIARFAAPDTIVAAVEEDPNHENFAVLQDNLERLRAMRDPRGKPFRIVQLPMPATIDSGEGPLPASYANFYIANGVVLAPVFNDTNDARALQILTDTFPGRRIVPIEAQDLVWGMGACHCLTQQQPVI